MTDGRDPRVSVAIKSITSARSLLESAAAELSAVDGFSSEHKSAKAVAKSIGDLRRKIEQQQSRRLIKAMERGRRKALLYD